MTASDILFVGALLTLAVFDKRRRDLSRRFGDEDPELTLSWLKFDEILRLRALVLTAVTLFLGAVMTWRP